MLQMITLQDIETQVNSQFFMGMKILHQKMELGYLGITENGF